MATENPQVAPYNLYPMVASESACTKYGTLYDIVNSTQYSISLKEKEVEDEKELKKEKEEKDQGHSADRPAFLEKWNLVAADLSSFSIRAVRSPRTLRHLVSGHIGRRGLKLLKYPD